MISEVKNNVYQVIGTGSDGNAVLYHNSILVDCGVSFKAIMPVLKDIKIILLTHSHSDHIKVSTLDKIQELRPTVKIAGPEWMAKYVFHLRNVFIFEPDKYYRFGKYMISPFELTHNVPNVGYRIYKGNPVTYRIFHATDTAHLDGIIAKNYDLYAIEHNYDQERIEALIDEKKEKGQFAYEHRALNSHLSEEKAIEFIHKNHKKSSQVLRLHESSNTL